MKAATPVTTQSKKDARKKCTVCKKKYQPVHRSSLTCSEDCNRARRNKSERVTTRKQRVAKPFPLDNAFCKLLIRHAKQAGTVQIVQHVTSDELLDLREMHKVQNAANSSSRRTFAEYHFSHIYPANGRSHTGKFVPRNLVLGSKPLNIAHGTSHFGGGVYINPANKDSRWDIQAWMTDADIMNLLIECIGKAVWSAFDKVAKLQPQRRQQYLNALGKLLDRTNPEHKKYFKAYESPSTTTQELGELLAAVKGKDVFVINTPRLIPMYVLIYETTRVMAWRPELKPVLDALQQIEQTALYFTRNSFKIAEHESFFFNVLHGRDVDSNALASIVVAALTESTSKVKQFSKYGIQVIHMAAYRSPEQIAKLEARRTRRLARNSIVWPERVDWFEQAIAEQILLDDAA